MYDMVIIGAGAAGLSAAIYARRAMLDTVVLEESPIVGGQILKTYDVDNYLGLPGLDGFTLAEHFRAHAEKLDTKFQTGTALKIEDLGASKAVTLADGSVLETRTVIYAAGAAHRKLGVPGEEALGGKGVSYCATCDGAFFRGKTVAVVGGGDVALEDAIFLARGCKQVYLIHRRDALRGAKTLQDAVLRQENITVLWDTVVEEIKGGEVVEAVSLRQVKTDAVQTLPVDGIFIAVGILPNTGQVEGLPEKDAGGYLIADETGVTSIDGIFAAGDVRTKPLRQIITAAADGANCVFSAEKYLAALQA